MLFSYLCPVIVRTQVMLTKDILLSRWKYLSLPEDEWSKDHFSWVTGGFVATHFLKAKDQMKRPGIVAEVKACLELAEMGKQILRLPENVLDKIDTIFIDGKRFRELLKFKPGETKPRGYPDVYFDGETWDFKTSSYEKEDTVRQHIKDGRKADNVIFIIKEWRDAEVINNSLRSEIGMRKRNGSWSDLPNVYCWVCGTMVKLWGK